MSHRGKAKKAGLKLVGWSLLGLVLLLGGGLLAAFVGSLVAAIATIIIVAWMVFAIFTVCFFRDPTPIVPTDPKAIVAPAHGKVDCIEEAEEKDFVGGKCLRISTFLSIFDVHVQNAPLAGTVSFLRHTPGQFLNAMNRESGLRNENVLVGFESREQAGERIAVRLIAGLIARRIVPWIVLHEVLERGERMSLIQFGSRVDVYVPLSAKVCVNLGDRVRGGETIIARRA